MITADYQTRCSEPSDIAAHLPRLYDEACRDHVRVIELGVRSGNSTAAFLAAAETHDGHVWSVDILWPHVPREWTASPLWTFTIGSDLDLVEELPDDVDIVFIDTDHTYDLTLAELHAYAPKVKPGGVILMHDTELERPDAATPTDPAFPVVAAIKAWAPTVGGRVEVEFVPGCHGLAVIRMEG